MSRGKRYTVAGMAFERQGDLEAAVKARLNAHPLNEVFHDPFLASVINEHHPEVIAAGQHATGRFEYLDFGEQARRGMDSATRFRGGKIVLGFFEPLGGWRDVTVYPWRGAGNYRGDVKRALREKVAPRLPRPNQIDRCARHGCPARGAELEYQHVEPTFDEVAEVCLSMIAEQDIANRFGYSKFAPGRGELVDLISDDHPAILHLIEAHCANSWEWLCAFHHRNVAAVAQTMLQPTLSL